MEKELSIVARKVRGHVVEMIGEAQSVIPRPLSATDILSLYFTK